MHFTDSAFVLSVRRHAEHNGIIKVLSKDHGVIGGLARGVAGKTGRGIWQPGNAVMVRWKARLPDQLGTLTGELMEPVASRLMASADALSALLSAASLVSILLPERAPHPRIYQSMHQLVGELTKGNFLSTYAQFELDLLAEGGFRLDLSACAATGATEELVYVSPKSGRAVSRAAGEPYKQKLLPLPAFFTKPAHCPPGHAEILAALQLTGYFLSHWMLEPHGRTLPAARQRLMQMLPSYAESA